MGIADYGIGPSGPYEYTTKSFLGIATIRSLSTTNSTGPNASLYFNWTSFQLNVNLEFNTNHGQYVYWIQDVVWVETQTNTVYFRNDIFNFSAPSAKMSPSGVSGNMTINSKGTYSGFANSTLPGNGIVLTYPTTITFNVTSGVSPTGEPTVKFAYEDGYGLITFDTVTFTNVTGLTSSPAFEVNGFNYNPYNLFYDAELIMGGCGGGRNTTNVQSNVTLQLEYWNGHNYQMVPNAYNFGSNTGEKIKNVLAGFSHNPRNGEIFAEIQDGAGQLGSLYNQSQIGVINIISPLASGTLNVTDDPYPKAWQIPFVNGEVTVTLYPGRYHLQLYNQYGIPYDEGNFTVSAGQILYLQTPWSRHDVAVTSVKSSKPAVGQGFNDSINVTVTNMGLYTETFTVTSYANATSIASQNVTLTNGRSTTITFTWNTTGFAKGNSYTISAYAWPVLGEANLANNNFVGYSVQITKVGDLGSRVGGTNVFGVFGGLVTSTDLQLFLQCFKGTAPAQWIYLGDLGSRIGTTNKFFVCNGRVDSTDLNLFLQCFKGLGPDP